MGRWSFGKKKEFWILEGDSKMSIDKRNVEVLDAQMIEILKTKTPQQRLAIAFDMWSSAKKQLINYLHSVHSDWDDKKIHNEAVRRLSHGAIRVT